MAFLKVFFLLHRRLSEGKAPRESCSPWGSQHQARSGAHSRCSAELGLIAPCSDEVFGQELGQRTDKSSDFVGNKETTFPPFRIPVRSQ